MRWNGKNFRAPGKKISVYPKPQNDIRELLKPLGEKTWKGNVWVPILNQPLNIQKETQVPVVSPSPTPTITPSPSSTPPPPSPSLTPTPTPSPSVPAFDADAAAYLSAVITAGGTTDATISAATNTLFSELKTNGLYSKLLAFYPFVGATADSHSLNGKTPNTYSISWLNPLNGVHNVSGFTSFGSSTGSYGRFTGLSTSDITTTGGDVNISMYIYQPQQGATDNGYDLCASDGNNNNQNYIIVKFNGGATSYYDYVGAYSRTTTLGGTIGLWSMTRNAGNTETLLYKDGSLLVSAATSIFYCTTDFYLGTEVANGVAQGGRNSKGYNFVTFGNRLDSSEQSTLSTIINNFQTALARNAY